MFELFELLFLYVINIEYYTDFQWFSRGYNLNQYEDQ